MHPAPFWGKHLLDAGQKRGAGVQRQNASGPFRYTVGYQVEPGCSQSVIMVYLVTMFSHEG